MRPLFFILGLAVVASVLIASVDAIKCYNGVPGFTMTVDCEKLVRSKTVPPAKRDKMDTSKCLKFDGQVKGRHLKFRSCGVKDGNETPCDIEGFHCCDDKDFCNAEDGDVAPATFDPPTSEPNGLKCYIETPILEVGRQEMDCDEVADITVKPRGYFKECAILEVNNAGQKSTERGCVSNDECSRENVQCTKRCSKDLCNGDASGTNRDASGAVTSTPAAPLLIAVITGVFAAVGI